MAKFAIECPKCGSVNTASNFILARKTIECGTCGDDIHIRESRLTSKVCPHCDRVFVYDQAKSRKKNCPSCGKPINAAETATASYKMKRVDCPQCACAVEVDTTKETYFCPVCDWQLNIKKELEKAKLVTDTGISVIRYEGDNSTFVWKHPIEDFNLGSQLVVHESQEAVFFLNGEALDLFGPGRYTLETENLPVLKKIYSLPTGGQTPFHAEVYFINKTVRMGCKWGTDSRVRFIDPVTGIPLDVGACGEMNLQVSDSRKLLIRLVGTAGGLTDKDVLSAGSDAQGIAHKTLQSFFRAPLMTEVKSYLASVIKEQKLNIFELDEKMGALSEALRERISPRFEEYGLFIPQFYITTISFPENDKNFNDIKALISQAYIGVKSEEVKTSVAEAARQRQLVEEQTKAQLEVVRAQGLAESEKTKGFAEAEVMRAKGYTQKDVLEADVQKEYAKGIGSMGGGSAGGGIASDLIGVVAGMKMAENVAGKFSEAVSPVLSDTPPDEKRGWNCPCGESGNTKGFCMNCGRPKPELWKCGCGHGGNRGKFCEECGKPKPQPWNCPCGETGNTGKRCPECGAVKPEEGRDDK